MVERALQRIQDLDPALHAFVTLAADGARQAARTARDEIRAGRWRGPLHGIPVGLKDVIDMADVPTMAQSRQLAHHVPRQDATVTRRLKDAGALLAGKLTTHEFAFGAPSWGPPGPPARNPWDHARFAGGSSSGAAVAIASGMLFGAIGTDTAGSVRSPAALCGVAGFKPGRQHIDRCGILRLAGSLDAVGVLAWTVEDCAILYEAIAAHRQATGSARPDAFPMLDRDLRGLRIGVIRHFYTKDAPISDDGQTAIEDALEVFRSLGCRVQDVTLAPLPEWNATGMLMLLAEAFALHEPWLRGSDHLYGESLRDALLLGATITAADYLHACDHGRRLAATLDAAFDRVDLLVTAIQPGEAPALANIGKWSFLERPSYGIPFNVSDHPALSICCGMGRRGLPLAVQLVAARNGENTLLRAGHAYELAADPRDRRPGASNPVDAACNGINPA
ncbi:MAG: amidase [Pigmentiphaga sp.]|uniref:amidase n=1 Tax=Pigmentiphaga sp. TaxID=1977564 RepID=UPI0029A953B9|nr:amidase [Pigmentiphaga sp.]MDX3905713.1 amidase [Pigmentiphaga sp.]